MMEIVWSPQAIDDLAALRAYIAKDSPAAATRVALRVITLVEALLADAPCASITPPADGPTVSDPAVNRDWT